MLKRGLQSPVLLLQKLFLLSITFLVPSIWAEERPSPGYLVRALQSLRTANATLSSRINAVPSERALVAQLLEHVNELGRRRMAGDHNGGIWLCLRNLKGTAKTAKRLSRHYGFGEMNACGTVMNDNGNNESKGLFSKLVQFSRIVKSNSMAAFRDYGLKWRDTFLNELLTYEPDAVRRCDLAKSLAYRVKGRWSMVALVTNVSVEIAVENGRRGCMHETMTFGSDGFLSALNVRTPLCSQPAGKSKDSQLTGYQQGNSTQETWGGRPSWSHYGDMPMKDNPAIDLALRRGDHERELVEDSETSSNLDILLLPASLALVPLGLFQEVSLSLTLLYTLATDVVSVLPVAIKGTELIAYSTTEHFGTVSHFYGSENATSLAAAETWVARCQLKSKYRAMGIGLLSTAISAMVVGTLLEFITCRALKRRRAHKMSTAEFLRKDLPAPEQSGRLLMYLNEEWY